MERSFHVLVLALLLRYSALSGGGLLDDLRGGGMQGRKNTFRLALMWSFFVATGIAVKTLKCVVYSLSNNLSRSIPVFERCHSF